MKQRCIKLIYNILRHCTIAQCQVGTGFASSAGEAVVKYQTITKKAVERIENMKKLKMLAVALGMVAMVSSALAVPSVELVVYDGAGGSISVAVPSLTGTATYVGSDSFWSVVVSVGTSYPPAIGQGTATSPVMDLSITATSIKDTTTAPLNVYFGASEFGPTTATINATISGHVVSGAGAPVTYKTYYSTTLDALPAIH